MPLCTIPCHISLWYSVQRFQYFFRCCYNSMYFNQNNIIFLRLYLAINHALQHNMMNQNLFVLVIIAYIKIIIITKMISFSNFVFILVCIFVIFLIFVWFLVLSLILIMEILVQLSSLGRRFSCLLFFLQGWTSKFQKMFFQ